MVRAAAKNHAWVAVVCDPADYPLVESALAAGGTTLPERRTLAARRSPAPPPTTPPSPPGWRPGAASGLPGTAGRRGAAAAGAAVRGEPAPGGGLLRRRRARGALGAGGGRPGRRQGAVLQQPARRRRRPGPGRRARRPPVRDHRQAHQPVRGGVRGDPRGGVRRRPGRRPGERLRRRGRAVAARWTRPPPSGSPASSPRSWSRPASTRRPWPCWPASRRCGWSGSTWPGRPAGWRSARWPGACWPRSPTPAPTTPPAGPSRPATRPGPELLADLALAWSVAGHVKSNAIVLARDGRVVGVGAGQQSRVDSVRIAVAKAGERARGAAAGSDAFFPFADGVEALAAAGVLAVAQPGGSVRDPEVTAAAAAAAVRHAPHRPPPLPPTWPSPAFRRRLTEARALVRLAARRWPDPPLEGAAVDFWRRCVARQPSASARPWPCSTWRTGPRPRSPGSRCAEVTVRGRPALWLRRPFQRRLEDRAGGGAERRHLPPRRPGPAPGRRAPRASA